MRYALTALSMMLGACGQEPAALGGDARNGKLLLRQFTCGACHSIPGVAAADGKVGPPLDRIAAQVYIAGMLPNTPQNMADFIRAPQAVDARIAMPDMGVTESHARDMVAYLYTLK